MSEVRSISATGGEKGVKPERYDLLPKPALDAIARVYAHGATKYADHNWRRGYEWSKSYAACLRHLTAFWDGETKDPESGLPHLAHAGFHVFSMLTWLEEGGEAGDYDDRYVPKHRREIIYPKGRPSIQGLFPRQDGGWVAMNEPATQEFTLTNLDPDAIRLMVGGTTLTHLSEPPEIHLGDVEHSVNGTQRSFDRDCE